MVYIRIGKLAVVLLLILINNDLTLSFQPLQARQRFVRRAFDFLSLSSTETRAEPVKISSNNSDGNDSQVREEAARLKAQSERMRLEAEQLEMKLTLEKISAIDRKLDNQAFLKRHPEERERLEEQLKQLEQRIMEHASRNNRQTGGAQVSPSDRLINDSEFNDDKRDPTNSISSKSETQFINEKSARNSSTSVTNNQSLCGFSKTDLDLYLPVVEEIEARLRPNATMEQKLLAFREHPQLQEHFAEKIRELIVEPMREVAELEDLKTNYLYSTSRVEKEQIKRDIKRIEKCLRREDAIESVYRATSPLSPEELMARTRAVEELPSVLQAVYKTRSGVKPDGSLQLAIQLEHYEDQLELLDRIHTLDVIDDKVCSDTRKAVESLPPDVREHVAVSMGLDSTASSEKVVEELTAGTSLGAVSETGVKIVVDGEGMFLGLPEYDDIDFIDRSRYLEEFYPNVAKLEGQHPTEEEVDQFVQEVIDKKSFMVNCKPERVVGGYYIRGLNLIPEDEGGSLLVAQIEKILASTVLKDRLCVFYIPDPAPLSDEAVEMGDGDQPVLLVTSKNATAFYDYAQPRTKAAACGLGALSIALFGFYTCELQPHLQQRTEVDLVRGGTVLSWLHSSAGLVIVSMFAIQFVHELAHRVMAWKDKFDIGFPTPVPSLQLGSAGAITPIKSPPPSLLSLFDFAIVGPLAGMATALIFLVSGLSATASMDMSLHPELPALPVELLRSSTLGGGLVEFFLGKGVLMHITSGDDVLPLHPFAVAGFAGILTNALALLPFGNTDGGRISVAMFGRRGAYVVNFFTAVLLVVAGIFGFDESNVFLYYVLYAMIWQRELETPTRNEVQELDIVRGTLAISTALFVALVLVPML